MIENRNMELEREKSCCFTGHRPDKLPWGDNERDPRCVALKASMAREIETLYHRDFRHFISGMALGADLFFAEAVLSLREKYPDLILEAAVPCLTQASRWPEREQTRWRSILAAADLETVVQRNYDRWCMHRRDRYMVDRASTILAAFDGTPGGTFYTLNYAASKGLDILLLDINHPSGPATWLKL